MDTSLSALDYRVLLAIGIHDGMSLFPKPNAPGQVRGGMGCYASHKTLAAMVGVDVTSFSRTLSSLIKRHYVSREPQQMDKRRFTLRIIPDSQDSCHGRQVSDAGQDGEKVDGGDSYPREIVDGDANQSAELVDMGDFETRRNQLKTSMQYIPLNGEIDFVETREIDSVETAHLGNASNFAADRFDDCAIDQGGTGKANPTVEIDRAKAQFREAVTIGDFLPKGFSNLPFKAILCRIEKGLKRIGAIGLVPIETRTQLLTVLEAIMDEGGEPEVIMHAERLLGYFAEPEEADAA